MLQPVSAIVTVCASVLRTAQTAPMYASQVKPMLDRPFGPRKRGK
jgi:hypothetical protein